METGAKAILKAIGWCAYMLRECSNYSRESLFQAGNGARINVAFWNEGKRKNSQDFFLQQKIVERLKNLIYSLRFDNSIRRNNGIVFEGLNNVWLSSVTQVYAAQFNCFSICINSIIIRHPFVARQPVNRACNAIATRIRWTITGQYKRSRFNVNRVLTHLSDSSAGSIPIKAWAIGWTSARILDSQDKKPTASFVIAHRVKVLPWIISVSIIRN